MTSGRRAALAGLALAAAACSSGPTIAASRFAGPSALVPFSGRAPKVDATAVRPYLAVAASRGDELRLVDPNDDNPVFGPGVVFPLSVTTAPRPLLLAAASLGDGEADLLVAVSAGGAPHGLGVAAPALQVVDTWSGQPRVAFDVSLADAVGTGADVLAVLGLSPRPGPAGKPQALVVVGLSGGRLVLVRFERDADGRALRPAAADAVAASADLGFDPLDLALEPAPGTRIFAATLDPIPASAGPVQGVAVVDTAGAPGSWVATALDARIGTVAVAAARVPERVVPSAPTDPSVRRSQLADTFDFAAAPLSVYAVLDPETCGPSARIGCGIATLRPDQAVPGLAADPAADVLASAPPGAAWPPETPPPGVAPQAFRGPIPVPGIPVHIALGFPPASGKARIVTDANNPDQPVLALNAGGGSRNVPAIAMVTSTDGQVYWIDVARFAPVSDLSFATGTARARVTSAGTVALAAGAYRPGLHNGAVIAEARLINLDSPFPVPAPAVVEDPGSLSSAVEVWPGFTPDESFQVVFRGTLPALSGVGAVYSLGNDGAVYVGAQTLVRGTGAPVVVLSRIGDPELGVRPGDSVLVAPVDTGTFPLVATSCTTPVDAVFPPGDPALDPSRFPAGFPGFPGGALRLAPITGTPPPAPALDPNCLLRVTGAETGGRVAVFAAGWVLSGAQLGYLGRPEVDVPFTLAPRDETGLSAEDAAIARKVRRLYYPPEGGCPRNAPGTRAAQAVGCYLGFPAMFDPLEPGFALRFTLGLLPPASTPGAPVPPGAQTQFGAAIFFATTRGITSTQRHPSIGGALPQRAVPYDRTVLGHVDESIRFYVPYADDQVLAFTPLDASANVASIR
ncbi:MAG TPA: hypothetical protein VFP65_09120 [Anaeromyxobacteraceae bacterium]|nr:hypothetical protein [Anaeromyxobacteraceae bacterium]